jgi:hypothetical protein
LLQHDRREEIKQHKENIKLNNWMRGKHHSEETKRKIGDNKFKNNGYLLAGENNGMFGKKHSEETKQKMREKALLRKLKMLQ